MCVHPYKWLIVVDRLLPGVGGPFPVKCTLHLSGWASRMAFGPCVGRNFNLLTKSHFVGRICGEFPWSLDAMVMMMSLTAHYTVINCSVVCTCMGPISLHAKHSEFITVDLAECWHCCVVKRPMYGNVCFDDLSWSLDWGLLHDITNFLG